VRNSLLGHQIKALTSSSRRFYLLPPRMPWSRAWGFRTRWDTSVPRLRAQNCRGYAVRQVDLGDQALKRHTDGGGHAGRHDSPAMCRQIQLAGTCRPETTYSRAASTTMVVSSA
jgi:hypothetical protein